MDNQRTLGDEIRGVQEGLGGIVDWYRSLQGKKTVFKNGRFQVVDTKADKATPARSSSNLGLGSGKRNSSLSTLQPGDDIPVTQYPEGVPTRVGGGNAGQSQSTNPKGSGYIPPTGKPMSMEPPAAPAAPSTGRNTSDPSGQSEAKGTQMGSRSASYDEIMEFLGPYASQFVQQPMNSSALPRTGPGERQQSADIPNRTLTLGPDGNYTQQGSPKYMDEDGNLLPGYSRETLIGPDGVESSTVTGPFKADPVQTVTTITPDDPMFAKAFGQDLADRYRKPTQSKTITPDDPMFAKAFGQDLADKYNKPKDSKNSGTNWMNRSALDNSDESVRRRTAFLDAPDVLSGLKARDAMYGKVYAGGQYHEIPGKGGNVETSYENKDVRRFMNADIGSDEQAEAQSFLENYKSRVKKGAAVAQNPMLNADESEGKATAASPSSNESDFVENNASPSEMKPAEEMTPVGGYVNGKPVDLESRDTPLNLRYTLTPEEVDEGLKNGTLDQMHSQLRSY